MSVTKQGVIAGCGFGSASTHDQHLAARVFAARHAPLPSLPSAGLPAYGSYVADKGFAGDRPTRHWKQRDQVDLITPPHQRSKQRWPKALRRWLASLRHISETVNDKLLNTFRLARERPHDLTGFQARLAAKVALHNVCMWFNVQRDQASFAFAEFLAWSILSRDSHQTFDFVHFQRTNRWPRILAQEESEGRNPHQDQEVMWETSLGSTDRA